MNYLKPSFLAFVIYSICGSLFAADIDPQDENAVRQFVVKLDAVFKEGKAEDILPLILPKNREHIDAEMANLMFNDRWGHGVPKGELRIERYKAALAPKDLNLGEFPLIPTFSVTFSNQIGDREEESVIHLCVTDVGMFLVFMQGRKQDDANHKQDAQQAGAEQPATAPELKSEGEDKH